MIKNYFKIAWRNLWTNKAFSAINILGLSIGLACCLLIFLFIQGELSYDTFNVNSRNIYRINSIFKDDKEKKGLAVTPPAWAPLMKKDYPEIREFVRLLKSESSIIGRPKEQQFNEKDVIFADSTFFHVFSFEIERGDPKNAFTVPNSIVLTKAAAEKYFGKEDPIGKTLEVNAFGQTFSTQVTAIVKKVPDASHFKFSSLVTLRTLGDVSNMWSSHMMQSYLLLNTNNKGDVKKLERKFSDFNNKYIASNPQADGNQLIFLQPLLDIHLRSAMVGEIGINSDIMYVYVFAGVAIFILLIACFNFINLSTARSLARAKEVGLRKVIGATRRQLLKQFLGETAFFAIIALAVAIIIAYLILPVFNQLADRNLIIDFRHNFALLITSVCLILIVGLLAGCYPAAILSSFNPIQALKGKFFKTPKNVSFGKILVTLQFVVSIVLIASTILVNQQLQFLQNKKLGFNKDNVVVLTLPRADDSTKLDIFKKALSNNAGIRAVGTSSSVPGPNIPKNLVNDGSTDLKKAQSMQMLFIDHDFIGTMDMKLLAGRTFSKEYPTDQTAAFVLNEEAVGSLGWKSPSEAIGKTFQWVRPNEVVKSGKIIGVVQNFNITPLKSAVAPLVLHINPYRFQYLYIRFDQAKANTIIDAVEKTFNGLYPKQSFEYTFLDDTLASLYKSEKKLGIIFNYFSFLAIFIACLGILGLSLYATQRRSKEIGIRKVIGASVPGITALLIQEFVLAIIIATLIAAPIVWYAMNKWLENFAYRVHIEWWVFAIAGILTLLVAICTVGFQVVKAAVANSVKSLRTE